LDDEVFLRHSATHTDPILLCFKAKNLTSKKRIMVAMPKCLFSDPFSIDAVGTKGSFVIPSTERSNMLNLCSVDILLSHFLFTKIVKINSFYTINSQLPFAIEVSEDNDVWMQVPANGFQPFWPGNTKNPVMFFRQVGSEVCSRSISISETSGTLLPVNELAIYCQVETTDHSISVNLSNYYKGCAPALLINYSDNLSVNFGQFNTSQRCRLPPKHKVYFTWHDPNKVRRLAWSTAESEEKDISLDRDEFGQTETGGIYWVCFLNEMQRIFLVTQDARVAEYVFQAQEMQKPAMQVEVDLNGLGVSFVDTALLKELCYFSISSSDIVWEYSKKEGRRYKGFSVQTNEHLETAYQKYTMAQGLEKQLSLGKITSQKQRIGSDLEVDFGRMQINRPVNGHLRRHASIGLRMRLGLSEHIKQVYLAINSIQLDNQLEDCVFSTVFCPVSPPKTVVQDMVPQPFIQCSALMHSQGNLRRFKYLSLLVQEFAIQIDLDFVNCIQNYLSALQSNADADYEKLVILSVEQSRTNERKNEGTIGEINSNCCYFDLLHFSPIKMHLSFSLGTIESFQLSGIFDYLAKTAGVTLIEFKDAVFKINFFERKNMIISDEQLSGQLFEHYKSQALSQAFVVILGLDVIGNPVGLLLGLRQGVGDLFYEPLMGIIQGPEEFAEGLVYGIRSLFSSTVGGAAGMLGKITGQLGQGISTLMETGERKKRRERLNQTQNLVQGSRNLAKGFFTGITGLVTKPLEGAKKQGFEGLVKGVGQGVVGLVAQPTTGIIDFTSGALNQLQRTVDINKEVKPVRLRRHLHSNGIVTSYNLYEAQGKSMLNELRKSSHLQKDTYEFHANLSENKKLMVTDRHLIMIERDILFNILKPDWYIERSQVLSLSVDQTGSLFVNLNVSQHFYL
jgi:vacuolar protein sorting-associated protein 13A/C